MKLKDIMPGFSKTKKLSSDPKQLYNEASMGKFEFQDDIDDSLADLVSNMEETKKTLISYVNTSPHYHELGGVDSSIKQVKSIKADADKLLVLFQKIKKENL